MKLFSFLKKQTPEQQAEMLYTQGITLIGSGYWDSAFSKISEAAELGHRGAVGQLAMMYIFGQGCDKDIEHGLELLERSVNMGNVFSCFAYSVLYDSGIEEVTAEKAEEMCGIAAKAGMPEAVERMEKGFGAINNEAENS